MARKKSRQKLLRKKQPENGATRKDSAPDSADTVKKKSFWRRILKFLPLVILAVVFTFIFNRAGIFKEVESTIFDTQMKLDMPAGDSDVVIVDIDDEDFKEIFQGQTRPLNPLALQNLLEAIAKGQPCVVGIDIDTSFPQFKNFKVSPALDNVIWERETQDTPEGSEQKLVPLDVLGGQNTNLNKKSGLPLLIDDERNVPRRYARLLETSEGEISSLAWAVFNEGKSRNCPKIKFPNLEATTDSLVIGYSRGASGAGRTKIHAVDLLKFAENPDWQNNNLIKGKIVLVGGSYLGEDISDTPLGKMHGVDIHANVIETELRGGGMKSPGIVSVILLQVFDGVLLISLFQLFSWRKAALLSLPFILVLSLACSFFTYYSFSYWLFFAPVMIGVVLTELIDKAKDHFKKRYKHELVETYQELSGQPPENIHSSSDEK